jgi:serine/threonine protein kinase
LLDAVLDLPRADRRAFLERECPDDPALRTEVLEILEAGEGPAPLLDRPAAQVAAVVSEVTGETRVPMPDRVGPYRIERVIGEGGMGTVFLAHRDDGHFDQQVALKLVRRGPHLDSRVVRRFREERQILAALSHPDIGACSTVGSRRTGCRSSRWSTSKARRSPSTATAARSASRSGSRSSCGCATRSRTRTRSRSSIATSSLPTSW